MLVWQCFFPWRIIARFLLFLKASHQLNGKKGGWRGWAGRRIIQICWKTRNGKMLSGRKLGYDMVESSPYTVSGCRLVTWRVVDLTSKPQSNHTHRLFVRNRNIFSLPLSLDVYWRLLKEQASLLCISCHHHSLSFCFVLLPLEIVFHVLLLLKHVFCLVIAFQTYVSSCYHSSTLCFITLSLDKLMFRLITIPPSFCLSCHYSTTLGFLSLPKNIVIILFVVTKDF